jgi:hypothetical protein
MNKTLQLKLNSNMINNIGSYLNINDNDRWKFLYQLRVKTQFLLQKINNIKYYTKNIKIYNYKVNQSPYTIYFWDLKQKN